MDENIEVKRFSELGLSDELVRALEKKGYYTATSVQSEAIPPLMQWRDLIAKAPTGTGKTFAFGIPIVEHTDPESEEVQHLILAPARELALQICDELRTLLEYKNNIRVVCLYGGQSIETQIKALKKKPQIVVATPGRLMDHYKRKTLRLNAVQTVVVDEADRMLDMGFIKDVTRILDLMPKRRNLALLSATISQEVMTISWKYQRDEAEVTVQATQENKPDITQYSIEAEGYAKYEITAKLAARAEYDRMMIFCNTKQMVDRLTAELGGKGITVDCIHGDIKQNLREKVMNDFKAGRLKVLIATDVASRGIDVDDVDCVLNFDIPDENEYYVHRIGRTGRAKKSGVAISLIGNLSDKSRLDDIASNCRFTVERMQLSDSGALEPAPAKKPVKRSTRRFF